MKALEFSDVVKRFGDVTAANKLSFDVEAGQIVSLLGPSGSGKTTILRLIAGFLEPDEGHILVAGKNVTGKRPYERNVGLLFQDYALFPHMTVEENIAYGMLKRRVPAPQRAARVSELLELVKLRGMEKRRPSQLSGGQKQRVALVRALATNPDLLLLDEPLSALDAKLRHELRLDLKEILGAVGTSTIIVTHDQEEAMSLGEKVIVQSEGRIMQQGTPSEIYLKPANRFVADFVGRSNWFEGRFIGASSSASREFLCDDGTKLRVGGAAAGSAQSKEFCVREERIRVRPADGSVPSGVEGANRIYGTIVESAYLVSDVHILIETDQGRRVSAIEKNTGQDLYRKGARVTLEFDPEDCIVV